MCDRCAREMALLKMARKAMAMGVSGVAVAFTAPYHLSDDEPDIWTADILVVDKLADSPAATAEWSPTGANYLGIAMGKLAQVCRTGQLLSDRVEPGQLPLGESGYRGCATYEHQGDVLMRTIFSGGTEQEDLEIAAEGLVAMSMVFDALAKAPTMVVSILRI